MRLLHAEWLKIRTTRTIVWYLAGLVVIVGISVAGQVANAPRNILESEQGLLDTLQASAWATLLALLFGIVGFGGEYRHGTITQAFLASPIRQRVLAAKISVYASVGFLFGIFALGITLAMALPWLAAKQVDPTLLDTDVGLSVLGILAAAALWGALGVAFASVVPNLVGAIVGALVWLLVVETIFSGLVSGAAAYTPGGAVQGLIRDGENVLPMWAAAGVSLGYVAALAAVGAAFVVRRDVT
jgi:ABC-2 type transport system permease protein